MNSDWLGQQSSCSTKLGSEPGSQDRRQGGQVVDRGVRDQIRGQRPERGPAVHRSQADGRGPTDIGDRVVPHHDRLTRGDFGELERTLEQGAVRLPAADRVRAHDPVDVRTEADAVPIREHLGIAAVEGVRYEDHRKPTLLAPAHRIRGAGDRGRHELEGQHRRRPEPFEIHVADEALGREPGGHPPGGVLIEQRPVIHRVDVGEDEPVEPIPLAERCHERGATVRSARRICGEVLDERVADIEERGPQSHADIVSSVLDFDQLAFIEKWRQRASRGVIVALDGTRGDLIVTVRVGELGERLDLRGRDASGAVRRSRLTIGDRVTLAIEYLARDATDGAGTGVSGGTVQPGAVVEGRISSTGEVAVVECGAALLVRGDGLAGFAEGDQVRFTVAEEGTAYFIPTR